MALMPLISLICLGGCANDGNLPDAGGNTPSGEIRFEIAIGNPSPGTRVSTGADFKSVFEVGDEIGIFAVAAGSALQASGNVIHNVKLTYGGGAWTPGTPLYFSGAQMDFYAYYPYNAAATNPANITFNVMPDQSTAANYSQSDLLSASAAGVNKGATVTLAFAHRLALVQVEVPYLGKGFGPGEDLTITLNNCVTGGTFNLTGGSLAASGSAQSVKMLRVETNPATATTYTYRALVPAQAVAAGKSLCLLAQEGKLYGTPPLAAALSLTAAGAERYTAQLPADLHTVFIPRGTFMMGSPDTEPGRYPNETQHQVTLTKDFYMSKYPVTFAQYDAFCDATSRTKPGDEGWGRGDRPVINVSWNDAVAYCAWLSAQTGQAWTLPTEAQWEYACRAGTTTAYSFGAATDINAYAWYDMNSSNKTHPVGEKKANPWGLYDMHGHVDEWVLDSWNSTPYGTGAITDPVSPNPSSYYHVMRGGDWYFAGHYCRSACRFFNTPSYASYFTGFRVMWVQ
ncbi:hypothetical protein FACS189411_14680 [Bacteroidia bacterium]|nr:hypothetical protein FACS189411_14680 [Bacteroidia bacterium]